MNTITMLALSLVSFLITFFSVPYIERKLGERGIVGRDLHKPYPTYIPTAGGLVIIFGFSSAFTLAGLLQVDTKALLLVYLVSVISCMLGLVDDILTLDKKSLIIFSLLIGTPFLTYHSGSTIVTLTPFGPRDLGILFWPLALLAIAFLSNAVNIYAGFNGLEAGLGLVTSITLSICAHLYNSTESELILLILTGSLLAFLKYNYYSAKIFIGNSGTYMIGAVIASAIIVGNIKTAGAIACTPYIINFILRLKDGLKWTVGNLTSDGKVVSDEVTALWSVFMYKKPVSERTLVTRCWLLQLVFGGLAVFYALLATYNSWSI